MKKNKIFVYHIVFLQVLLIILITSSPFQGKELTASSSEIYRELKKLNVLGSVLYIAAHPDDENSAVITYMSKGKLVRTAYLSLTRGDGGQNLLGSEKGDLLGLLRTQELLAARRIDGGEQYFSRAIDFGYSKTSLETLNNWDHDLILGDIVKVIRQFKPDVILTRFSKTKGGHGHHLASAMLAEEAFYTAADSTKFTNQLKELNIWQAKRIYWNTWKPDDKAISIDIGEYNEILGESYNAISAKSRSMHKSQGFGATPKRGSQSVYFNYTAGEKAETDLFDGIDLTWERVNDSKNVQDLVNDAINNFDFNSPQNSIPILVKIYNELNSLNDEYWKNKKQNEVKRIIQLCSGLWMESTVKQSNISPGNGIDVNSMIINRSGFPITLERVNIKYSTDESILDSSLNKNKSYFFTEKINIPLDAEYSQPYWLREQTDGKMFTIPSPDLIGKPDNKPALITNFVINIDELLLTYTVPVQYKWNDAIKGEQLKSLVITPNISISLDQLSYIFAGELSQNIHAQIETEVNDMNGELKILLPEGWKAEPEIIEFKIDDAGDKLSFDFTVTPSKNSNEGYLNLIATVNGKDYTEKIIEIDYPHIPTQTAMQRQAAKLINLDIEIVPKRIGYIMGSGDDIPDALTQIGYDLNILSDSYLDNGDLSKYDVIICGVRAFNTRPDLGRQQKRIIDFVENGGTWIVQHNTRFGFKVDQIGPYPYSTSGRDRISEEDAPIKILEPENQIFNYPNKITEKDFDNWVQERGLYFAQSWGDNLHPLLAGNDTGESSKKGGLLYANYGKGIFIFTAYSWFRQLPAGVPGAYRLFANLISARGNNE